jgi:hypothetical protein
MTHSQKVSVHLLGKLAALLAQQGVSSRLTIRSLAWDVNGSEHSATCRPSRGGFAFDFEDRSPRGPTATRSVFLPDFESFTSAANDLLNASFGA